MIIMIITISHHDKYPITRIYRTTQAKLRSFGFTAKTATPGWRWFKVQQAFKVQHGNHQHDIIIDNHHCHPHYQYHDNHHLPPHHHCQVYPELDEALLTRVMGTAKLTIMEENSFSGEESFLRIYEKYFPPNFTSGFDSRITSFFPIINFQGTMISRILSSQLTQTLTQRLLGEASFEARFGEGHQEAHLVTRNEWIKKSKI